MQPIGLCYPMPAAEPVTAVEQQPEHQIPETPGNAEDRSGRYGHSPAALIRYVQCRVRTGA
jgi:hypothetical protein